MILYIIFFDNTATDIKVLLKNSKEEVDEYILKEIKASIKLYDKKTYITDIIQRSLTNLFDKQFITILDSNPDFLPINNGKKINLKTLEITNRTYLVPLIISQMKNYPMQINFLNKFNLKK